MALAMPSRFAVLKIEDDDFKPPNPNKTKDKKKSDSKQNKKEQVNNNATKKPSKKKDKKKKETTEQWEQWKVKDHELADGHYEQDLQDAIMLSKLDYEEKKNIYKQNKKEAEQDKKDGKKKKNKTMTLEQFNNLVTDNQNHTMRQNPDDLGADADGQFFERVNATAKEVFTKEQKHERISKGDTKKVQKERKFVNETVTIAHMQEKLDAQIAENVSLREELDKCKHEILAVKSRNKTLCGILAHGEMKDKADVLIELDRLSRVRDELTEEVSRLNGLLEQERSKTSAALAASEPHNTHNHNSHGKKEKHRKKGAA